MSTTLETVLGKANKLLDQIEQALPQLIRTPAKNTDWSSLAFRWQNQNGQGLLAPVTPQNPPQLGDLLGIDRPKRELDQNTRQFLRGLPANNALLWGPRGTGKSTLVRAILSEHARSGLRLIEVEPNQLADLPEIVSLLGNRPERFIIYCDDLSFEGNDASYKALKSILDGSLSSSLDNVLVYATSNRRHLLPEYQDENQQTQLIDTELHHGEAVEEKISLSERFGLWLSFKPFNQTQYIAICEHWLQQLGKQHKLQDLGDWQAEALRFALLRGSRSGRVAWQFARHWIGQQGLGQEGLGQQALGQQAL